MSTISDKFIKKISTPTLRVLKICGKAGKITKYIDSEVNMNRFEPFHWCLGAESNHRHGDFQSPALPSELPRRMVDHVGVEPT